MDKRVWILFLWLPLVIEALLSLRVANDEVKEVTHPDLMFLNLITEINGLVNDQYYRFGVKHMTADALMGKDGWLFYAAKDDGDPIADYRCLKPLTEAALTRYREDLTNWTGLVDPSKILMFTIPNKHTVYAEQLPDRLRKLERPCRSHRIRAMLADVLGESFVDLVPKLSQHSNQDPLLYYRRDTHWNGEGLKRAIRVLDDAVPELALDQIPYKRIEVEMSGDVGRTLNLKGTESAWQYGPVESCIIESVNSVAGPLTLATNVQATYDKSLLLYGDSFVSHMVPAMCGGFRRIVYHRAVGGMPDPEAVAGFDYVFIGRVERYL